LLLPWKPMREAGTPAASATASSPAEHTSTFRPASIIQRATSVDRNALPA
jgi:hypothetical protein